MWPTPLITPVFSSAIVPGLSFLRFGEMMRCLPGCPPAGLPRNRLDRRRRRNIPLTAPLDR